MTDAPERMWRETIFPCAQYREGGSFYHETRPPEKSTKRKELVEYIRADIPAAVTVDREAIARAIIKSDRAWNADESITQDWADFLADAILSAITPGQPVTEQPDAVKWVMESGAIDALASYQQADEDGIMVLVSRQAVDQCVAALRALEGGE